MTKNECRGKTSTQIDQEIRDVFTTHIEIVGDASLKWERLFRYLVMENNRFPLDRPIQEVCTAFFQAIHSGEIVRYGSTIEAHLRSFGSWLPKYSQHIALGRAGMAQVEQKPIEASPCMPDESQAVTRQNWNLVPQLSIVEIKRSLANYDTLIGSPTDHRNRTLALPGVNGYIARCRASVRRYESVMRVAQ